VQDVLVQLDKTLLTFSRIWTKRWGEELRRCVIRRPRWHAHSRRHAKHWRRLWRPPCPRRAGSHREALESFGYQSPHARITGSDVFFLPKAVYEKLSADPNSLKAVLATIRTVPGVAAVIAPKNCATAPPRKAHTPRFANSYFPGRSGDLFILPKPYWL